MENLLFLGVPILKHIRVVFDRYQFSLESATTVFLQKFFLYLETQLLLSQSNENFACTLFHLNYIDV